MKHKINLVLIALLGAVCMPTYAEVIGNTDEQVRTIAAPILDNILEGIKTGDYAKYVKDFDQTMKDALPQSMFIISNMQIQHLFGQYLSSHYLGFLNKNHQTLVLWKARYDKTEDDVLFKLSLSKRGDKNWVTGLWFQ
jgi:hypothetical protein